MYAKRVYRVVDGKLQKKWDGDPEWFKTKAEAWAAVKPKRARKARK